MKERPILFSAPMVRAILSGQKTQTRRVVKPQPVEVSPFGAGIVSAAYRSGDFAWPSAVPGATTISCKPNGPDGWAEAHSPYGQPGDRLWVRESWQYYDWNEEGEPCIRFAADNATTWPEPGGDVWADKLVNVWEVLSRDENFRIDQRARDRRWRPSIHMPRWACRILLKVASVRVERLHDISAADCIAEGTPGGHGAIPGYAYNATPQEHYRHIWTEINGAASWDANPWVWVVEFNPQAKEIER